MNIQYKTYSQHLNFSESNFSDVELRRRCSPCQVFVLQIFVPEDLDRHEAVRLQVDAFVNVAVTSFSDLLDHFVTFRRPTWRNRPKSIKILKLLFTKYLCKINYNKGIVAQLFLITNLVNIASSDSNNIIIYFFNSFSK